MPKGFVAYGYCYNDSSERDNPRVKLLELKRGLTVPALIHDVN